jgi:hypothetical protein
LRPHWDSYNVPLMSSDPTMLLDPDNPGNFVGAGLQKFEPNPGETKFSSITLTMTNDGTTDPGMLVGYRIKFKDGLPIPGIVSLHDKSGAMVTPDVVRPPSSDGTDTTITSYSIVKASLTGGVNGTNSDYFIGATLIPGVDLDDGNYTDFSVIAQPLVNTWIESMVGYEPVGRVFNVISHDIGWRTPSDNLGLLNGSDLEYQLLYWYDYIESSIPGNLFDLEEVLSFNPIVLMDWTLAEEYAVTEVGWDYQIPDILSASITPNTDDHYFIVLLARLPGGEPFLIGAYYNDYYPPLG